MISFRSAALIPSLQRCVIISVVVGINKSVWVQEHTV